MERLDNSKLSPIQNHIVNMISREQKIAIVGGPGTGKTVLAMSGMSKNGNAKQILLTYSNPLSRMINGCSVDSNTVHSFCWQLGSKMEQALNQFENEHMRDYRSQKFRDVINREYGYGKTGWPQWDNLYNSYCKLPYNAQKEIRYNDIFIDEGQDLPNEAYDFFSKIADRIVVTYDDAQEVGRENEDANVELIRKAGLDCNRILSALKLQESFYDLVDNFRNTVSIERVAKLFYNNYGNNALSLRTTVCKRSIGELPEVIFSNATQTMIDQLADTAYQMNKQVGIIVPDQESFELLKQLMDNAVSKGIIPSSKFFYKYGYTDNMKKADNLNQTGVFLVTFKSAKGMEFDEAYIMNCQKLDLNTPADKNKFYVAVTRAKDKLTLTFNCSYDYNCAVLNVIKQNEALFKIMR